MQKTRKVMNIEANGVWLTCIYRYDAKMNKYYLYQNWWDGGEHKRLVAKFANFQSVLLACANVSQFKLESED